MASFTAAPRTPPSFTSITKAIWDYRSLSNDHSDAFHLFRKNFRPLLTVSVRNVSVSSGKQYNIIGTRHLYIFSGSLPVYCLTARTTGGDTGDVFVVRFLFCSTFLFLGGFLGAGIGPVAVRILC